MVINTTRAGATGPLAPADGVYVLDGMRYRVRMGHPLPEGAAFEPAKEPAAPTGPQAPDRQAASAALGEGYAAALQAAGYSLVKDADIVPGELLEGQAFDGEALAELLREAGYALPKPAGETEHPKWYLDKLEKAREAGEEIPEREDGETKAAYEARVGAANRPAENTDGRGPSETA